MSGKIKFFITLPFLSLLVACATIIDGGSQEVVIDSFPRGAKVYHDDFKKSIGVTPIKLKLSGHATGTIYLRKEGYKPQGIFIKKSVNRKKDLNALALPAYGVTSTIDELSGAAYKFRQGQIFVEMKKIGDKSDRKRKCIGCKLLD